MDVSLPLPFHEPEEPRNARLAAALSRLADEGVFLGTSSWKYPGWLGQVYRADRYTTRGKFAETRFRRECLSEYADLFPTVCVDAGYYQFPQPSTLRSLMGSVPAHFRFGFKVTDEVTVLEFPKLARYGARAGARNPRFLDPVAFTDLFLGPLEPFRKQVGVLLFEFSRFHPGQMDRGAEFVERLDRFFSGVPRGWPYGVEIRNPNLLHPEYFATLTRHGVAHVYNSWTRMPSVSEQMRLPGSRTTDFFAARFLLSPGRTYEQAVGAFGPYRDIVAPDLDARDAATRLVEGARRVAGARPSFLFVNNRLEGNSPRTIAAIVGADG